MDNPAFVIQSVGWESYDFKKARNLKFEAVKLVKQMISPDILWLNEGRNLVVMLMTNVTGAFIGSVHTVKWERSSVTISLLEFKRFKLLSLL